MKIAPKSDSDLEMEGLLPAGTYDFEVKDADDTTSKAGNDMIKVKLGVFDDDGASRTIFDYLLEAMPAKLKHFAYATGLGDAYENGGFDASDCLHRAGKVKIKVTPAKGDYAAKNEVADYIAAPAPVSRAKPAPMGGSARTHSKEKVVAGADIDDEIPF